MAHRDRRREWGLLLPSERHCALIQWQGLLRPSSGVRAGVSAVAATRVGITEIPHSLAVMKLIRLAKTGTELLR
jgi:hypothetical protein